MMTQMTPPPPPGYTPQQPQPHQPAGPMGTSKLAIVALVCSLLICIPYVAPLAGIVLAIAALVTISKSQGRKGGKGLAIAAVVLSCFVMLADVGLTMFLYNTMNTMFCTPAKTFIQRLQNDDIDGARAVLSPTTSDAISDEELAEWKDWISSNCGKLVDVSWDFRSRAYSMGITPPANMNQRMMPPTNPTSQASLPPDFPGVKFVFDSGTYYGVVSVSPKQPSTSQPSPTLADALMLDGFVIIKDGTPKRFPPTK